MPTFTPKLLANGQLPNVKGTLYTCPALTNTLVKTITLVATNVTRTVNIYIKRATSRRIIAKDTPLDIALELNIEKNIILEAGDLIEGDAAVAAEIDYTIFGIEQT